MTIERPEFLIFFLIFILISATWKVTKIFNILKPLRLTIIFLIFLILSNPKLNLYEKGIELWVLLDKSNSTDNYVTLSEKEWKKLLEKNKKSKHDKINYINYAGDFYIDNNNENQELQLNNLSETKTSTAILYALSYKKSKKLSKILIFTDGYSTESLKGIGQRLLNEKVKLYYRLSNNNTKIDYRISDFKSPSQIKLGEAFILDITVRGNRDDKIKLKIYRNNKKILDDTIELNNGINKFKATDRVFKPGSFIYKAEISSNDDSFNGNNTYKTIIQTISGSKILLLTKYKDDPIEKILSSNGHDVIIKNNFEDLAELSLNECKVVIINNIPAYELNRKFLKSLNFFIKYQGGGLLIAGGKYSYGVGGFYSSPIDNLLPVSMELKKEHRKLAIAMGIVIDRSGSMSMGVTPYLKKIDLANEGTARTIELLGSEDYLTVFAVDSLAHIIVPLMKIGGNEDKMTNMVRRIKSVGGGIFVHTGLKAAWNELAKSPVDQKHIILFSDARDSEEPGDYKNLLEIMKKQNCSVSVIGLGKSSDTDSLFLKDIADRGNGRIFFTEKPEELPAIFSQETVSISRSAYIKETTPTVATGFWHEISAQKIKWLNTVDSYNLNYLKPGASSALNTNDDYKAPLVAFMKKGSGRTMAVTFPLGGELSKNIRNWEKYSDFIQTITTWLTGEKLPPGLALQTKKDGDSINLKLLYDNSFIKNQTDNNNKLNWNDKISQNPPKIFLENKNGKITEHLWNRINPGLITAKISLNESQKIRGAIIIDKYSMPFGPIIMGNSIEWDFNPKKISNLKKIAEISKGGELINFKNIWDREDTYNYQSIINWLLAILIILIILEISLTRSGLNLFSLLTNILKFSPKINYAIRIFTSKIKTLPIFSIINSPNKDSNSFLKKNKTRPTNLSQNLKKYKNKTSTRTLKTSSTSTETKINKKTSKNKNNSNDLSKTIKKKNSLSSSLKKAKKKKDQ